MGQAIGALAVIMMLGAVAVMIGGICLTVTKIVRSEMGNKSDLRWEIKRGKRWVIKNTEY